MTRHPDSAQQIIVLDNCALNDILVRNPSGHLADGIRVAALKHQIAVWTSPSLVAETVAGSGTDRAAARKKLAFLRVVSGGHMLKHARDLFEWEGLNGCAPSDTDRFMPRDEEEVVYEQSLAVCDAGGIMLNSEDGSERVIRELIYEEKAAGQRAALKATDATRQGVIRAFEASLGNSDADPTETQRLTEHGGGIDLPALGKWIRSISRDDFARWVSVMLEDLGYKRIVTADDLPLLPHATSAAGYFLAKIAGNYVNGQKWQKNDTYDARYCVAASQADILVTTDIRLQALCAQMPYRPFRTSGIRELADLLAQSSQ